MIRKIVSESPYEDILEKGYQYAFAEKKQKLAEQLLLLILKYGNSKRHLGKYQRYIQKVLQAVSQKTSIYHRHEAIYLLNKALEDIPYAPELHYKRAEIYYKTDLSLKKALEDIEKSIQQSKSSKSVFLRGRIHFQREEWKKALADFKECKKNPLTPIYKSLCFLSMNKKTRAGKILRKIQKERVGNFGALLSKILYLISKGKIRQARKTFYLRQRYLLQYRGKLLNDVLKILFKK